MRIKRSPTATRICTGVSSLEKPRTMEALFVRLPVCVFHERLPIYVCTAFPFVFWEGAPVAQWVKRWPNDLADRVRSPLETKSSQP